MKRKNKWKKFLCPLCMVLFACLAFSRVAAYAEETTGEELPENTEETVTETEDNTTGLSFTDENGNIFTYVLDAGGNATVTGITVSGETLAIPASIADAPVAAVSNGSTCVVKNPEVRIPELTVDCPAVGTNAFSGLTVGTLVIGEDVKEFSISSGVESGIEFTYGQFAQSTVEKVVFNATELVAGHYTGNSLDDFRGPFDRAEIGGLEIGSSVKVVPEMLFRGAAMELEELELQAERIGAYAFSSGDISIGHLTIGENVRVFEEYSNSTEVSHHWEQFSGAGIGTLAFLSHEMELGHAQPAGGLDRLHAPFMGSTVGSLEIGSGVTRIPELFLCDASIAIGELHLSQGSIGAYAFSGSGISIGTLVVESTVECLEESYFSTGTKHCWEQFSGADIGTLVYLSNEMELGHARPAGGLDSLRAPFMGSTVGSLEIGSGVTRIPELFLCDASMAIEELHLSQSSIGAHAFSGSGISIGTLVIESTVERLEESYFSTGTKHCWEQFSGADIGTLVYLSNEMELGHARPAGGLDSLRAPFMGSTVGSLEIGSGVTRIPELFLCDASMAIEELHLSQSSIGAHAFSGSGISIGTLVVESTVERLEESYFSTGTKHCWEQFAGCSIGHLVYGATAAETARGAVEAGGITTYFYGPFDSAAIGAFTLAENVESIPDFLLKGSRAEIGELELHVPSVGAMAFHGTGISIGKLTIGEEVAVFRKAPGSQSSRYWEQFAGSEIGEVHYHVPSLALEGGAEDGSHFYGPFDSSRIGHLYLPESVERYPAYIFADAVIEQEELAIHAGSIGVGAFAGSGISIGTLTIGAGVETFEHAGTGHSQSFRQFMDCTIGTLVYLPTGAETGEDCTRGIFEGATIGNLVIDPAVEKIPNYLFYNATMELGDFTLNVPDIGYYSFTGTGIAFGKLTIGEAVSTFRMNENGNNRAFDGNTIGLLCYNATHAQMEELSSSVYGPFSHETQVNGLTVGEKVEVIPYGCFREAEVELAELSLDNLAVGYAAFRGSNIHIGTLNIGSNVSYEGVVSDRMDCFRDAEIGTLNYNSSAVEPEWSTSRSSHGMFAQSVIGQLNIGEDVETIPAFWFRSAALTQETLTLSCAWSYYSFCSSNITVGTLTLNGDMAEISHVDNYNRAFSDATIGTLVYNLPNAVFTPTKETAYGPFYNTEISTFILGEHVEYIDYRLLRGNTLTDCYVYSVEASESFLSQSLTESYLPVCTNLHIHYNSDFKAFFSREVTENHWLCVDYFDTTYGEKLYDEETGTYSVELFKTCSVCGYSEQGVEELDASYDVYLSIPVEIPLAFDAGQKSYAGQEAVYAYGRLGNAYEGVRLMIDMEAESYGSAVMGENTYDVSDYLSVGFADGESAVFDASQLSENAAYINEGSLDSLHQEQMTVSVNAAAFTEGGAGEYKISIPLRFELVK